VKIQLRVAQDGTIAVMDDEFEPIPGAKAEIMDAAEGLLWIDVTLAPSDVLVA
jgi:hypothetical protein